MEIYDEGIYNLKNSKTYCHPLYLLPLAFKIVPDQFGVEYLLFAFL
jgi:hypothetical protein